MAGSPTTLPDAPAPAAPAGRSAVAAEAGAEGRGPASDRVRRLLLVLFGGGLFVALSQAFVPMDEFVHRADDAFYYFKIAVNFHDVGFWTFDAIHSTNGVQPLWAILLTGLAAPLRWLGVDDPDLVARVFVGFTAAVHFAAVVVLFRLLSTTVSRAAAVAAAGAFLFPLPMLWPHVWGMENSLYALSLLSSVALFHLWFLPRPSLGRAVGLGVALGLTGLSRLNGGVLAACLLAFYLAHRDHGPLGQRVRLAAVAGVAAAALVGPYLAWNLVDTGHVLPVSGAVKQVESTGWLAERGVDGRLSPEFAAEVLREGQAPISGFVESRATSGLWLVGARLVFDEAPRLPIVAGLLALAVLGPCLLPGRRDWVGRLRDRASRLAPFAYVGAFAALDAALVIFLFPDEMDYAIVSWWLVGAEVAIVVLVAVLVGELAAHLLGRFVPARRRLAVATVGLTALVALSAAQAVTWFWDGEVQHPDWNLSWNDESLLASRWLDDNVEPGALVGSWNAGVLGFYADQRVVNLDGLINGFDLLPFLEEERIGDYIQQEGIRYLADLEPMFELKAPELERLTLTEVYRHHSSFARADYVIYRVG